MWCGEGEEEEEGETTKYIRFLGNKLLVILRVGKE